jgi:hypothetical protein
MRMESCMTRYLFPALALPLLMVSAPAPADNPPTAPPLPKLDIQFTPAPPADTQYTVVAPADTQYTVVPPGVLLQLAPATPQHELPMVIVQVDPSKYPIVMSQGVPGYYPMTIVPVPGGQMDAPSTTIPYQGSQLVMPGLAQPLKLLITPPKPAK